MNPIELPEEGLLEFPCTISVKVMGKADSDFDAYVTALVRRHFADIGEGAVRSRKSNKGNFIAVTVKVTAENREQLDRLYQELTDDPRVLMAL